MKKGLGKGLSALFEDTNSEYESAGVKAEYADATSEIAISEIHPNANQPRKNFDEDALEELKNSILTHGVITPIIVVKDDEGYMIVAGERRYRASVLAGLKKMPVIVKEYSDKKIAEIALIENLQREDLNIVESAKGISELMAKYKLTQMEIADRLGKSRSNIANILRILNLPISVITYMENGALSFGHGRALAGLENQELCEILARECVAKNLSVRDLEKKIQSITKNNVSEKEFVKDNKSEESDADLKDFERKLTRKFASKVTVSGNQNKGKIIIEYFTKDDLQRYYDILLEK